MADNAIELLSTARKGQHVLFYDVMVFTPCRILRVKTTVKRKFKRKHWEVEDLASNEVFFLDGSYRIKKIAKTTAELILKQIKQ